RAQLDQHHSPVIDNHRAHADDRAVRIVAPRWITAHGREKKERGWTSTNFHSPPVLAATKVTLSLRRECGPPFRGSNSISASTVMVALSPSTADSIRLAWSRIDSVWKRKLVICSLKSIPRVIWGK